LLSRSASKAAWVDLPDPSPPSNVMKRPRIAPPSGSKRGRSTAESEPLGAGAERPNHQFAGGIEGALRQVAPRNALGGTQRHFEPSVVATRDPQLPDRLPLLHRCRHRPRIDNACRDLLAHIARDQEPDDPVTGERHPALGAAIKLRLPDGFALG